MTNLPKSIEEAAYKRFRELDGVIDHVYKTALHDAKEQLMKEMPKKEATCTEKYENLMKEGWNQCLFKSLEAIDRVFKLLEE